MAAKDRCALMGNSPLRCDPVVFVGNLEEKGLMQELESGTLSMKEFLKQSAERKRMKSRQLLHEFNTGITQLNQDIEKGTRWLPVRNFLIIPLQTIFIAVLIFGYAQLLVQVSQRTYKKKIAQPSHGEATSDSALNAESEASHA